ncbi:DUF4166 domain-containing protein [Brevibacterium sp.]|uniref:DUF4166 domain-containing protein n=1 Tax=Brevibacterium sp. TaxID=1701 RepID=UPI002649D206|nr:DUF4166 domain-containing protein [Brevibacterium sp.]MDN6603908.1 DUF4166 domain-containing protein [Brevibacterium sp.]
MSPATRSPYERALGVQVTQLHPVLQHYFAAIPEDSVGIGEGVFDCFGTDRRCLKPFLTLLARCHVIVPGMHHQVPFRIENRTVAGRQTATRTLELDSRPWSMVDAVSLSQSGQVVDSLGQPSLVEASFDVATIDGGLSLRSHGVTVWLGRVRLPIPRFIRPMIVLHERFDAEAARQRVDLTVDIPILGQIYQYRGSFKYRIEKAK